MYASLFRRAIQLIRCLPVSTGCIRVFLRCCPLSSVCLPRSSRCLPVYVLPHSLRCLAVSVLPHFLRCLPVSVLPHSLRCLPVFLYAASWSKHSVSLSVVSTCISWCPVCLDCLPASSPISFRHLIRTFSSGFEGEVNSNYIRAS